MISFKQINFGEIILDDWQEDKIGYYRPSLFQECHDDIFVDISKIKLIVTFVMMPKLNDLYQMFSIESNNIMTIKYNVDKFLIKMNSLKAFI